MLSENSVAPDFTMHDQDGVAVTLAQQSGSWVLLWWYPKASTPG